MSKILVLYYSTYGHIETMASAVAEGARSVEGTEVVIKRVPELMSPEVAAKYGAKLDQAAPVADPGELGDYDAILSERPRASATWRPRCGTSSTRPAVCG